jgi:hypothetical protein
MKTIYDRYNCPRDAIPEILSCIDWKSHEDIGKQVQLMGISSEEVISLLTLEIHRLRNNMVACRKAAKRAQKHTEWVEYETNHIINVVNTGQHGTAWWD